MYLGLVLIVLAVLFAIAGIFSGGAFTIVLVPLAIVAVVAAVAALVSARAAGIAGALGQRPEVPAKGPPRGGSASDDADSPVTPDEYVEARQRSQ